jgi:hypothetical protein
LLADPLPDLFRCGEGKVAKKQDFCNNATLRIGRLTIKVKCIKNTSQGKNTYKNRPTRYNLSLDQKTHKSA